MRKDINMDFVKCHSCNDMIDVSKQALVFADNPEKQIIKKVCDNCGSISQLVISMVYGLTSIERINKLRKITPSKI